ncbi:ATP-dependent DNA helicase Q5 [Colletotrichum shisoi]|uniref:ATP-dependent DNA helicase Q5 n=1 Tax=Colletotrichum shisoi TaxID=2078593 RepID=A0A5Q4BDV9_9PEZI|nr:ATP-dependent DNA helicase Q5 [Colletotrichum shisoi]
MQQWKTLFQVDTRQVLQRLYGDGARFQGLQERAIGAIMANKSPVVVVIGTGGGKSLYFMLPAASYTGGVTVVVVPLVSLLGDIVRRCGLLGIQCAEWKSERVLGQVSIVFVTPESAMSKRFQDYLEGLRVTAQLDRIVVDECYTILDGSKRFQLQLRELGQLRLVGVQIETEVEIMRTRTTRTNIRYSVQTTRLGSGGGEDETTEAALLAAAHDAEQAYLASGLRATATAAATGPVDIAFQTG